MDAQHDEAARAEKPSPLDLLVAEAKAQGQTTISFDKLAPILDTMRLGPLTGEPITLTSIPSPAPASSLTLEVSIPSGDHHVPVDHTLTALTSTPIPGLNGTCASDIQAIRPEVAYTSVIDTAGNSTVTVVRLDGPNHPPEEAQLVQHSTGYLHVAPTETVEDAAAAARREAMADEAEESAAILERLKSLETKVNALYGQGKPSYPAHEFRIGPGHRVAPGTEEQEITVRDVNKLVLNGAPVVTIAPAPVPAPTPAPAPREVNTDEVLAEHQDSFRILMAFRQVHKAALTKGADSTEAVKVIENMVLSFKRHYHNFLVKTGTYFLVDFILRHQNQLINHRTQFLPAGGITKVSDAFDGTEFKQRQFVNNLLIMFLYQHTETANKLPETTGLDCFVALQEVTEKFDDYKRDTEKLRAGVAAGVSAIIEATTITDDPFAAMK